MTDRDAERIKSRIGELRVMRPDDAVWQAGLDRLEKLFSDQYDRRLPLPYMFPCNPFSPSTDVSRRVLVEWDIRYHCPTLEVDLNTMRGDWHRLRTDGPDDERDGLDISGDTPDWQWVVRRITILARVKQE